ncbi:MAG: glutaredoxin family protein [Planctomycetia bacterium]
MNIVLYTRRGCHLCAEAEDLLACAGRRFELVDVDAFAATAARYGLRVPVLEAGGRVVLEGRFDAARLARVLSEAEVEAASGEGVDEPGG